MPTPNRQQQPIDYRRTFLHRHIANELTKSDDILALSELQAAISAAYQQHHSQGVTPEQKNAMKTQLDSCRWLLPYQFFYHREPETRLYYDVQVQNVDSKSFYPSLTGLLDQTRDQESKSGVLLLARSGSGKTVASRKAMFDCFFQAPHSVRAAAHEPNLFGYLPCWLNLTAVNTKLLAEKIDHTPMLYWLLDQANVPGLTMELLEHYLEIGPPLLIFADLNAVIQSQGTERAQVATQLEKFQLRYQQQGHRLIVTYRATELDDAVMSTLQRHAFQAFDMLPLEPLTSITYLKNYQEYENTVYQETLNSFPPTRYTVDELKKLVFKFSGTGGQLHGLISTPLLMHFLSQLEVVADQKLDSLSDLFKLTVNRYIQRDLDRYGNEIPDSLRRDGNRQLIAALVRIAIVLFQDRAIRFSDDDLTGILSEQLPIPWKAIHPFWTTVENKSPYYQIIFDEIEIRAIKRFSLFHRALRLQTDGKPTKEYDHYQELGFVHDSFIYYFVGTSALGEYLQPRPMQSVNENPALDQPKRLQRKIERSSDWYSAVVNLLYSDPTQWAKPAGFMSGALTVEELQQLLVHLTLRDTTIPWLDCVLQTLIGRPVLNDPILEGFNSVVQLVSTRYRQEQITQPLIHVVKDHFLSEIAKWEDA